MTYIKKIAEMFGVELKEKFQVGSMSGIYNDFYYFDEDGLYDSGGYSRDDILMDLIIGDLEIVKNPWQLKNGAKFYFINTKGEVQESIFDETSERDLLLYKAGKVYCKKAEARKYAMAEKEFWTDIREQIESNSF